MAVKIIRQPRKIALLGVPTSAAALRAGHERAPAVLRAAGLAERLKAAGFDVTDLGDTPTQIFKQDDEHPRARNVSAVLKSLNDLRPLVELAVKSGALPVILCGDSISALATIAGTRRYYRNVSLVYMDRDAGLNVPATTPSGNIDGMVVSHVIGRGAPELIRFWGEPPLIREADVALFGYERLDAPEERYLGSSLFRDNPASKVASIGGTAAAEATLQRIHAAKHEFVLHMDVDVISGDEFPPINFPGVGGLGLKDVRDALSVFVRQPNLAALDISGYNPDLDPSGDGARLLVDLLVEVLRTRLDKEPSPAAPVETSTTSSNTSAVAPSISAPSESGPDASSPVDSSEPVEPDSLPS